MIWAMTIVWRNTEKTKSSELFPVVLYTTVCSYNDINTHRAVLMDDCWSRFCTCFIPTASLLVLFLVVACLCVFCLSVVIVSLAVYSSAADRLQKGLFSWTLNTSHSLRPCKKAGLLCAAGIHSVTAGVNRAQHTMSGWVSGCKGELYSTAAVHHTKDTQLTQAEQPQQLCPTVYPRPSLHTKTLFCSVLWPFKFPVVQSAHSCTTSTVFLLHQYFCCFCVAFYCTVAYVYCAAV